LGEMDMPGGLKGTRDAKLMLFKNLLPKPKEAWLGRHATLLVASKTRTSFRCKTREDVPGQRLLPARPSRTIHLLSTQAWRTLTWDAGPECRCCVWLVLEGSCQLADRGLEKQSDEQQTRWPSEQKNN